MGYTVQIIEGRGTQTSEELLSVVKIDEGPTSRSRIVPWTVYDLQVFYKQLTDLITYIVNFQSGV